MKNYMLVNVPAMMAETIGMSHSEVGGYFLCLVHYWMKRGPITVGEGKAICGNDWERVRQLFVSDGERWSHARMDSELASAANRSAKATEKALKGVAARRALGQLPKKG